MSSSVFWEGRDMFLFFGFFIYIYEFGKFLRYFSCVCVCADAIICILLLRNLD